MGVKNESPMMMEWIKENSSVSTVAADLNLSRPTVYKYVDKFDNGDLDKIPKEVIEYFRTKITSSADKASTQNEIMELEKQIADYRVSLEKFGRQIDELMKKRNDLMNKLALAEVGDDMSTSDSEIVAKLKTQLEYNEIEYITLSRDISITEDRIEELRRRIAELKNTKFIPQASGTFVLKSQYYSENGRYMIVHTGEVSIGNGPLYYRLHLYTKIGDELVRLGTYKPVKNRNFFIIDDVLMNVPLYYNIVTCVVDDDFDDWDILEDGEEPPILFELSGRECTGLCELKPKK